MDFEHVGVKLGMVIGETFTKAYELYFSSQQPGRVTGEREREIDKRYHSSEILPIHLCYVDFRSALIRMLCSIAYYRASVQICYRNALFVTTCGRFVNSWFSADVISLCKLGFRHVGAHARCEIESNCKEICALTIKVFK